MGWGGYFTASGSQAIAVEGDATGVVSVTGGLFSASGGSAMNVGVGASGTSFDFYAIGPGTDYGTSSSIRWKKNIYLIDRALDKILSIRGVYFDWDEEHGGEHDMGFIAEEIGEHIPEIVEYEPDSKYAIGVDYGAITPVLVEAVKELKAEVDALKDQNEALEKKVEALMK